MLVKGSQGDIHIMGLVHFAAWLIKAHKPGDKLNSIIPGAEFCCKITDNNFQIVIAKINLYSAN